MATVVIDSGSGNLRSVYRALEAAGSAPTVTADPDAVRQADRIVVPGQGAFGDCVKNLRQHGLDDAIKESLASGTPYFGICLGLQILFASSEESDGEGLAVLAGDVRKFSPDVGKVPHMGWNSVTWDSLEGDPLLQGIAKGTYFYFTHSYHAEPKDCATVALQTHYGHDVVAAVRNENIFACQFHPEKSQGAGIALLRNFLKA